MIEVTVYSKPNCVQCTQTKKKFDQLSIRYTEESVLDHLEEFKQRGHLAAPVVTVTDDGDGGSSVVREWSGYSERHINDTKQYIDFTEEWEGVWND